jgi:hypothetical protein
VAKETEHDGKYEHDRAGDVRSAAGIPGLMLNDRDQQGKDGSRDQHAAGIDANTADPLFKVIAVCPENKPLISEERKRDGEKICQQARENVSVREERGQQQREQGKAAVAKGCIERTDRQVAKQRCGHRRRRRSRIHDREWRQHQRETHRRASVCRGLTPPIIVRPGSDLKVTIVTMCEALDSLRASFGKDVSDPANLGANHSQLLLDVFVASVDVVDAIDDGFAIGDESSQHQ